MIRLFVTFDKFSWGEYLVYFEVAYSSSASAATELTPFYLSYQSHLVRILINLALSPSAAANEFMRSMEKNTEKA